MMRSLRPGLYRGQFLVWLLFACSLGIIPTLAQAQKELKNFVGRNGTIAFKSDAPLEFIQAQSSQLRGAINPNSRTFAFKIEMASFQGFNSALQRQHFNSNYLESHKYPEAYFGGKIIEEIDFSQDGTYNVRAKGTLRIHNIEQERIIRSQLTIRGNTATISGTFVVPLADHQITIPKIVSQKIAEEIQVVIQITMKAD